MFIFGHKLLKNLDFSFTTKIEEIKEKKKIYCIFYDEKLISHLSKNNFEFAILVQNKDELFIASALGAKFLIFENAKLAQFASKVAEFYLFDSKILMLVNELENFEKFYKMKVDGVILKNSISNLAGFKKTLK